MTTNGQVPFLSVFMYLNEAKEGRERDDLALVIEEVLRQRIRGVRNESGAWVTPAFPKLIYVLQEDSLKEGDRWFHLTRLAAECTASRMVPDYISEKVMRESKVDAVGNGQCYPCMGCRSFLTPHVGGDGKPKYYGRFNQGVVTLNLVDVALSADRRWGDLRKLTEPEGEAAGLEVMRALNGRTARWREAEGIDYSLYGTPIESTTYRFAKCLQRRFGIVPGVTDRSYITNSYHVHVTEEIDAFSKLALEAKFQALSPGGAISYVEVPDMRGNIEAVLAVMRFIYGHILYAELNTKSDHCQKCGWDGEIGIVERDGKLVWQCPKCGNTDQETMNVARRTCGYIGTQFWNQGRTAEIRDRALHL